MTRAYNLHKLATRSIVHSASRAVADNEHLCLSNGRNN